MEKVFDIVAIGEILIDFVGIHPASSLAEVKDFRRAAGGGPANLAVGAARLGMQSGFIGKVGEDAFGRHLAETLASHGVNIEGLIRDPAADTTMVFVSLSDQGEPDINIFRPGTADTLLNPAELPVKILGSTKFLHFSSVALSVEPSRSACLKAVDLARAAGASISFDPNLRLPLWPDIAKAKETIRAAIKLADVVKMNDEEYLFLTGETVEEQANKGNLFWHDQLRLLAVTRGEKGAMLFNGETILQVPAVPVQVVDTTGAGDAFMAGLLTILVET